MTTTATLTEQWPKQWAERGFLPVVDVLAPDEAIRLPRPVRRAGAGDPAGGRRGADLRPALRRGVRLAAGDASAGARRGGGRSRAGHRAAGLQLLLQVPGGGAWRAVRRVAPGRDLLGPRAGARHHRLDRHRRRRRGERMHERDSGLPPPGRPRARQVRPGGQPPQHQPGGAGRLVDEARAVSMPLRAGQMSLHDGMLLHGSHPNRSSRRRCGLAVRFTTPDVRQVSPNSLRGYYRPVLVRGVDRYRNFPPVEVPWRV